MSTEADPTAFNEILRKSYSHGLEEIYALQDVDVKTIRTLDVSSKTEGAQSTTVRAHAAAQIALPLGHEHQCAMDSFLLREPIQVIGLPQHLETYLHGKGIATIKELLEQDLSSQREIDAKTKEYIKGRHLYQCDRVDFAAWMRAVIGTVQPLKAHIALEAYGLEGLYPLTPQQKVEWRRLDEGRRRELAQQTWDQWKGQHIVDRFAETLREITDAFIKPWIRNRQGLAVKYELQERLERIAENSVQARQVITCFEENLCLKAFMLDKHLCVADKGLYADSLESANAYDQLIEVAMTYFYRDDLTYDFQQLFDYLMRELVRRWDHFSEPFVIKALRTSPQFRVRKGENHKLKIWLA
jgi:hypothetical protein